jgi:DNA-binding transcriptional ArsR family regulator
MVVDVEPTQEEIDRIFSALADATRRDILVRVIDREQSVSSLARPYAMSLPAVQKHVTVLERAALVVKHRRGREQILAGRPDTVRQAADLLDAVEALWVGRMSRIADVLGEEGTGP